MGKKSGNIEQQLDALANRIEGRLDRLAEQSQFFFGIIQELEKTAGESLATYLKKVNNRLEDLTQVQKGLVKVATEQEEETTQLLVTQNELLQAASQQMGEINEKLGQLADRNDALLRKIHQLEEQ